MAMDTSKFDAIKNKARKMIHEDAQKDSHIIKARQADRNNPAFFRDQPVDAYSQMTSLNGSSNSSMINESAYVDDSEDKLGAAMDNRMKQYSENRQTQPSMAVSQAPMQVNKNLPKEILESFSNNYIDQSAFDPNMSVLDKMGITGGNEQPMQESYVPQQSQSTAKVDYEMIKAIVESSVKKYVNALGKKMLNENKSVTNLDEINAIQITDKKIAIVTKSGNLYEGKLQFVKNVKGE